MIAKYSSSVLPQNVVSLFNFLLGLLLTTFLVLFTQPIFAQTQIDSPDEMMEEEKNMKKKKKKKKQKDQEISPKKLGKIASRIQENPEKADKILERYDLTMEEFQNRIWSVVENADMSNQYRLGYSRRILDLLGQETLLASVGHSRSELDRGFDDWNRQFASVGFRSGPATGYWFTAVRTDWFNQIDSNFLAGTYFPINDRSRASFRVGASPTHDEYPKYQAYGDYTYWLGDGFEIEAGLSVSDYDVTDTRRGLGTLRRYFWNSFWASVTVSQTYRGHKGPEEYYSGVFGYRNDRTLVAVSGFTGDGLRFVSTGPATFTQRFRDSDGWSMWGEVPIRENNQGPMFTFHVNSENNDSLYDRDTYGFGLRWRL